MKIIRWILCHLLSIILLIALVLVFTFRDTLKDDFNRMTGKTSPAAVIEKKSDSLSDETKTEVPAATEASEQTDSAGLSQRQPTVAVTQENDKNSDPWGRAPAEAVNIDESKVSTTASAKQTPAANASIFPPENYDPEEIGQKRRASSISPASNAGISTDPAPVAEPVGETNLPVNPASPASKLPASTDYSSLQTKYYQALKETRQLHWNGDMGQAQADYEKLMFDFPEQPEAAAELGNLFLQQGNREAAKWAYQNAIPRYLNLHREQEAINLTRFISQYDPAIAESLQKQYW